jgi:hypothetical protein
MQQTITGKAANGKGNALIVTDQGTVFAIDDLDAWDSLTEGRELEVTGIMIVENTSPDALRTPTGEWIQGTPGERHIIRNASWIMRD